VAKTKPLRQNDTWQTRRRRRRRRRWAPNPRIDLSRWSCLSDCGEAEDLILSLSWSFEKKFCSSVFLQ
jgi:hypothetical protein